MKWIALLFVFISSQSQAQTLFEAFYRIEKNGNHIGYAVQRLSSEPAARTQTITTYVRMKMPDNKEYFESFKSVAQTPLLTPVSTHYRGDMSGTGVDVRARFTKGKVVVERRADKVAKPYQVVTSTVAVKRPFLSSYLFYISDFKSLKPGLNYTFDTFIDRDAIGSRGNLTLAAEKAVGGAKHLQLVVDTSADPSESFVAENGYPLGSRSTTDDFVSYWVSNKEDAVGTFEFPNNEVIALFGDLPQGQKNPWSKIPRFDAKAAIASFPKSTGTVKLSKTARKKVSVGLPTRAPAKAGP